MNKMIFGLAFLASTNLFGQIMPLERLEKSPRHQEWVDVKYGNRSVKSFLVFPEVSKKVPVIIVIHENRGLNDWARSVADKIAEAGYIAIAPDLLSGTGPDGGGTNSFANADDARTGIYALKPEQVTADLDAVVSYAEKIPAGNGKVAVIGFCWGGSQAFNFASNNSKIKTSIVCYGTGPTDGATLAKIKAPVYGFYGGNDQRVNATIPDIQKLMDNNKQIYKPVIYEGAGHGFFRAGEEEGASEANIKAAQEGWNSVLKILGSIK
jgi:carboxymethylenebutenolidase